MFRVSYGCGLLMGLSLMTSGCSDWNLRRGTDEIAGDTTPQPSSRPNPSANRRGTKGGNSGAAANEAGSFAQIRRDLRRLVAAQETFYAENGAYSGDLSVISFTPERNTTIRFLWTTPDGWAASGTHVDLSGKDCVVFVGRVHAPPTTLKYVRQAREGVPVCDDASRDLEPVASPKPEPKPAEPLDDNRSALEALNPRTLMKADLRNLVRSQETYFATQGIYARRTGPLALQYLWRPGVRVKILAADRQSWAAKATHPRLPGKSCVIWFGSPTQPPVTDAQRRQSHEAGDPVCDE